MNNDYIIAAVPCTLVDMLWEKVLPELEKVVDLAEDELSTSSIYRSLKAGDTMLVTISNGSEIVAANILEMRTFDTGIKALYIPVVGGTDMENWLDRFLEIAKAIAIDHGCTQLRGIACRKGWIKKLEPLGWEEVHTIIKCEIGE